MDFDGIFGGLVGLAVLGSVTRCLYCGTKSNSHICPKCKRKHSRR